MSPSTRSSLFASVLRLLRPLVRILLRNGIPYGTFADLAKSVYVDVATQEFGIPSKKQSASRVSIITGLTRKEVSRVRNLSLTETTEESDRYHRAARVIGGWVRDDRFHSDGGEPADLFLEGEEASFGGLVKAFSGDIPSRSVLDELLRVGAIERLPDGRIRLLARAYVPQGDEAAKLDILGTDVKDLIQTIDHNLQRDRGTPLFQRKVSYDNLPLEVLPEFRALTHARAQGLLEEFDRWLSSRDRDVHAAVSGTGRHRAGVGIFYFEEAITDE